MSTVTAQLRQETIHNHITCTYVSQQPSKNLTFLVSAVR